MKIQYETYIVVNSIAKRETKKQDNRKLSAINFMEFDSSKL